MGSVAADINQQYRSDDHVKDGIEERHQTFSIEQLFDIPESHNDNNIYEVIHRVECSSQQTFKYVQIHREVVQTMFSKHEVLQLIDVSEKVLYEMALGEKRIISLINATVSHDMRNPLNSI